MVWETWSNTHTVIEYGPWKVVMYKLQSLF